MAGREPSSRELLQELEQAHREIELLNTSVNEYYKAARHADLLQERARKAEAALRSSERQLDRERNARQLEQDTINRRLYQLDEQVAAFQGSWLWPLVSRLIGLRRQIFSGSGVRKLIIKPSFSKQFDIELNLVRRSGIFDADYYLAHNPDVKLSGDDPLLHFMVHGWQENRSPSASFDLSSYLAVHPEAAHDNAVVHFLRNSSTADFLENTSTSTSLENRSMVDLSSSHNATAPAPTIMQSPRDLGKIVVFSAVSGGYDQIHQPTVVDPSVDYVLFTDTDVPTGSVWQKREFDFYHADPTRTARFIKTHPHLYFPDHDLAIWVDGNLRIDCHPLDLVDIDNEVADMITWRHPIRSCVYEEIEECIVRRKDDPVVMRDHVDRLKAAGYPEQNGMIESSVVVFRHRRAHVIKLLDDWWRLIDNGSRRDQLSLNPALFRHPDVQMRYFGAKGVEMRNDTRFTYSRHPTRH